MEKSGTQASRRFLAAGFFAALFLAQTASFSISTFSSFGSGDVDVKGQVLNASDRGAHHGFSWGRSLEAKLVAPSAGSPARLGAVVVEEHNRGKEDNDFDSVSTSCRNLKFVRSIAQP